MQIPEKEYNAEIHDRYKALTIHQPNADTLVRPVFVLGGQAYAERQIELRSRKTSYRGDLLITSSKIPVIPCHESGVTLGFVELYDVKPASELTETEWALTGETDREKFGTYYAWMMRNPRRVVEMPVDGQRGIYNLVVPKGDITEYPLALAIDDSDWDAIQNQIK